MKSKFICLFFFLLSMTMIWAKEPAYPRYGGFVNDFAGVLGQEEKTKLETLCQKLEQKTGAEMAIVSVPSAAPLDTKEYAVKLFEKWKIGKKGKDNGLLVLLAMEEKRIEIEVGYGLEGVVNDAKAGEILDKYVIPYFREGKFGEGLYSGAVELATVIAQEGQGQKAEQPQLKINPWIVVGIVAMIILNLFASGLAAGLFGALFGALWGFFFAGIVGAVIGAIMGFVLSYFRFPGSGYFGGGWGGGGFGGGFGGFGGGGSGGGGSGRNW